MAERKSGPVKPPVIDLKARDASPAAAERAARTSKPKPDPKAEQISAAETVTPEDTPKPTEPRPTAVPPPPQRPQARLAMPWSAISIATIGGALLGTVLTYLLGNFLALPTTMPVIADPAARLDAQAAGLAGLEDRFATLEARTANTQVSLDATIVQLDTGLAELRQSLAEVRAAIPAAQAVDLGPLETGLKTLEDRVAAIGAGASSADATALAGTLAAIETSIAELQARLTAADQRFAAAETTLGALDADLDAAKAAIAAQTQTLGGADIGPAVKLPLVVSGLESAFGTGRPYSAELASLTALLPNLSVPQGVAAAAADGLPRPDAVAQRFTSAVPDILAGRTGTSTGDWGQDALEWAKALLALRPSEEIEGDTPEAIISRLEAAVGRRDFIAATALLSQLPAPMRDAAGSIGTDIVTLAEAETFIAGLRTQALAPALATEATP